MGTMHLLLGICVVLAAVVAGEPIISSCLSRVNYPTPSRDEKVIDNYFGVKVNDPYRWMENLESTETRKFIDDENRITRSYIDSNPAKREIREQLTELWNYPKLYTPMKAGNKYFSFRNTGLQNQDVLYVQDKLDGEARVFLDPNTLSQDGSLSIAAYEFSYDGATLAYGLRKAGSEWMTIHFKDVETGKDYPEILENIKYTKMAWTEDNRGFFYSRYPSDLRYESSESNRGQKLYYHRLNTAQLEDVLVFEYPLEPYYRVLGTVSDDGKYLIVYVSKDAFANMVFYADLKVFNYNFINKLQFKPVVSNLEAKYKYITNEGSFFVFRTNKNAPNFRLVLINIETPQETYWDDLVSEHKEDILDFAKVVAGDKLILHYLSDAKSRLQLHDLRTGELVQVFTLDVGYIDGFFGRRWIDEIFFHYTSFFTPGVIYYLNFSFGLEPVIYFESQHPDIIDPSLYEIDQVFYPSKDGTKISMFILSKKGIVRDSSNPVLLTAYGSFGYGVFPSFDVFHLLFMKHFNGIVAIPNIRGAGECGAQWHAAGSLFNKQKAIEDFQAAAEFMIAEKYTRPSLLTVYGKTDGALLVAASINQRPDLFGAAIIRKGFLDMMRYNKFTTGSYWSSEYGTSENVTQFFNLINFSPLHNVRTPLDHRYEYPATLVMTSVFDKEVYPAQSLKYIATLQNAVKDFRQYRPLLSSIETSRSTSKTIDRFVDTLSFMSRALALDFKN